MNKEKDSRIRVVVIEDNRFIRDGLELMLKAEPGFKLVDSYPTCEDAFYYEDIAEAEIVLIDLTLPGISGIEGIGYLKRNLPGKLIIASSAFEDDEKIFDAIINGAVGFISKKTSSKNVLTTLRNVYNGGSPITPNISARVNSFFRKENHSENGIRLTNIEQEVIDKISCGKSYVTIANELFETEEEILSIVRSVYTKLQSKTIHFINKI